MTPKKSLILLSAVSAAFLVFSLSGCGPAPDSPKGRLETLKKALSDPNLTPSEKAGLEGMYQSELQRGGKSLPGPPAMPASQPAQGTGGTTP